MNILALDVGTSSVKAALWRGQRMGKPLREEIPNTLACVRAEINADALVAAVEKAACEAATHAVDVIALDVFSASVVVCDPRGKVRAGIITHADRRSVAEARAIEEQIGRDRILKLVGNRPVPGGIGCSTLRWLADHSTALKPGARVGQASSLLLHRWTNQWLIDPSQAGFLGLWDIQTKQWNAEVCAAARVNPASLPRVVPADTIVGHVSPAAARRLGVKAGTPIVGGHVDTGSAVLAAGWDVGQLVHNAGSTDVLALVLGRPRPGAAWLMRPLGTGGTLPERWIAASTIAASGSAIAWIRKTMFSEMSDAAFQKALRRACAHEADASPLTFPPYLAGDRTDVKQRQASILGLTLASTREDILAAMVAGLVDASRTRFLSLARLATIGKNVGTMGGATVLGDAMHRAWPRAQRLLFRPIEGEALRGLKLLAEAVMHAPTKADS